jgi:hypothetical protein
MKELGSEFIDLYAAPAWVATDANGAIVGVLSSRLIWNLEPLLIFPEVKNKITASRATYGLFKAAESWIQSPANNTGIHWYFIKTYQERVCKWASRVGLFRQWEGASFFIKHISPDSIAKE